MRISTGLAALAAVVISATQAMAWDDSYKGDPTSDPARSPVIVPYPTENYCPAGKQPVFLGGVIFCGVPYDGTPFDPYSVGEDGDMISG